jgi:hypothetical protein
MEIDAERFRRMIVTLLNDLRTMEIEALTLKMLYAGCRGWTAETFAAHADEFEQALKFGRNNAEIKATIDKKYKPFIQSFNQVMDAKAMEDVTSEFLKTWKPTTKPN